MQDGRDANTPLGLDPACKQHEFVTRRVGADLEPFVGMLGHHARCKGAEVLAVLDHLIEDVAHVRSARVGEQRTVAEGARPEFHATLKPGDDLAVGDHVRGIARRGFAAPGRETGRLDRRQNFAPVERGTEIRRGVAALGRPFLLGAMHDKGGADRGAASCGAEGMNTSEKSPDCRTSSLVTQLSATPPAKHRLSSGTLRLRRRTSAMTAAFVASCSAAAISACRGRISDIRIPRRTEQGLYSTRLGRLKADRLRVYRIILLADAHDRLECATEDLGIAVGCQAHDLRSVVGARSRDNRR